MKRLLLFLLSLALVLPAFSQGGGGTQQRLGVVLASGFTATQTFTTPARPMPQPGNGAGALILYFAGVQGSPSGCTIAVQGASAFSNAPALSGSTPVNITPANGFVNTRVGPGGPLVAEVSAVYSCTTYPSAGSISIEYIPEPENFLYIHMAANGNFQANNGLETVLHAIIINTPGTSETITVRDSATNCSGGTVLAVVTPTAPVTLTFNISTFTGLCATTAGTTAGDYTLVYR